MKRSPSSSCSSSSSCVESETIVNQLGDNNKPKTKRARVKKDVNQDKVISTNAGRRSSVYRGVTRDFYVETHAETLTVAVDPTVRVLLLQHRWTGRFEAHLWDKSTWNSIQNKKGRQIYLGAYDNEEAAARTYDLAALKYWGSATILNFEISTYAKEIEAMEKVTKEEYLASLRRQSSGFSRGVSKYRGVARHHHNGRWEARIGRVFGNKYLYLGTYSTQEEAAAAYDMAAIEYRGPNAVTNFDVSVYADRLKEKKIELSTTSPPSEEQQLQEQKECDRQQQQCGLQQQQEHNQEEKQVLVQTQDLNSDIPSSIDSVEIQGHDEHPWSLCMDPEFHPLPITDVTYGKGGEFPYLFGKTGFQDDIDFIFDGPMDETLSFDTDSFFASSVIKEETEGEEDHKNMPLPPLSSSSSSPSSSTTTLVYCN